MRKSERNAKWFGVFVVAVMFMSAVAQAAIVDVTLNSDKSQIQIGEKAVVTVMAQVRPSTGAPSDDGLLAWGVDATLEDVLFGPNVVDTASPDILAIPGTAVIGSAWDGAGSSGTSASWGLEAIWDTQFSNQTRGFDSPVTLFTIEVQGLALGTGSVVITGNPIQGAEVITHQGIDDDAGFYGNASTNIQVVPEPAALTFLSMSGMVILWRRK